MVSSRSAKLSSLNKNIRDVIAPSETLTFGYLIILMSRCFWFPDKAYLVFVGFHQSFYDGFHQSCSVLTSNILGTNEKSELMIKPCVVCGRQKISSVCLILHKNKVAHIHSVIILNCHLEVTIYQQIVILLLILYFARPT